MYSQGYKVLQKFVRVLSNIVNLHEKYQGLVQCRIKPPSLFTWKIVCFLWTESFSNIGYKFDHGYTGLKVDPTQTIPNGIW